MNSVMHATFTIERNYKASPERVFAAFSDPTAKTHWFIGGEGWQQVLREDDFRVDGGDRLVGRWADGTITDFRSRYEEIVPNARIIFTYHMRQNETPLSVSLATVQFQPSGDGTKLLFTEQLTCLDGYEDPGGRDREHGTRLHLERLAAYLNEAPAAV
jgi:uncharacterized protein YndB with AHSA1/START domain